MKREKLIIIMFILLVYIVSAIAVYDADNQPEPDALKLLVERAVQVPGAVGAVGYVWTLNESRLGFVSFNCCTHQKLKR